jgi:hypothetical protein
MFAAAALRRRLQLAALVLVSALGGSLLTGTAMAYQDNMVAARGSLQNAYNYLNQAANNKGGHKQNAMGLIQQAIHEVNLGIRYAEQNGNG